MSRPTVAEAHSRLDHLESSLGRIEGLLTSMAAQAPAQAPANPNGFGLGTVASAPAPTPAPQRSRVERSTWEGHPTLQIVGAHKPISMGITKWRRILDHIDEIRAML